MIVRERWSDRKDRGRVEIIVREGGEERELPLVIGVLGDFSGPRRRATSRVREARWIEARAANVDAIMNDLRPGVALTVENRISADNTKLRVDLSFARLDDFHPERVARSVEPLRKLIELRSTLRQLLERTRSDADVAARAHQIATRAQTERQQALDARATA